MSEATRRNALFDRLDFEKTGGLIVTLWLGGAVAGAVLNRFHKPGQYGLLEIVIGVAVLCFLIGAVGFFATIALVVWRLLAERRGSMAATQFIPLAIGLGAVTWYFGSGLFHATAFFIWKATPWGLPYSDSIESYRNLCEREIHDAGSSSRQEPDWHAGPSACAPIYDRLQHAFPQPAWLFGSSPWRATPPYERRR